MTDESTKQFILEHFEKLFAQREIVEKHLGEMNGFIFHTREKLDELGMLKCFKIEFNINIDDEGSDIVYGVTKDDAQYQWLSRMPMDMNQALDSWDLVELHHYEKEHTPGTPQCVHCIEYNVKKDA